MREPVVVGNWKMHATLAEARALARAVRDGCRDLPGVRVVLCPSHTALAAVGEALAASPVLLGAQDAHWAAAGAFTGAVSPTQVADAGARVVILGHSERRQHFGETDAVVRRKVDAVLAQGLVPLVCVGETLEEREGGRTAEVVDRQVAAALAGRPAEALGGCWIAYEPVWAIGTGRAATPAQAALVHARIRDQVAALGSAALAGRCPVLYGGSVKAAGAAALLAEGDIDGALVGGASLEAPEFLEIVRVARAAKRAGAPSR
jgi:triosephosphate isomerase